MIKKEIQAGTKISTICPLCDDSAAYFLTGQQQPSFDYFQCINCSLIFMDAAQRLGARAEKERYLLHENSAQDLAYIKFLNQLRLPLLERIKPANRGLDYGCGPSPVLADLLQNDGYEMAVYDSFFYPNQTPVENQTYDFITCTETMEHFYHPRNEFEKIISLIRPEGYLGLMTKFYEKNQNFESWYYRRDPTHVCFYSATTIKWMADNFQLKIHLLSNQVAILQKMKK